MKYKKIQSRTQINTKILCGFGLLFVLFSVPGAAAQAASLYLSPSTGTYEVGSNFSVKVKVNSGGQVINAAEATLTFNPAEISVVSISKTGSIFSLWTQDPTFLNSVGNIVFSGGTPTPFTGTSGTLITITFKAKIPGPTQIGFSSGSVLAADGKGTNILNSMNGGVYTLKPRTILPSIKDIPPEEEYIPLGISAAVPLAPVVYSSTHPDPNKWYSNDDPEFSWKVPSDVTAVKLLIGHSPMAIPTVLYSPPISEKKLENLEDGVWYFHIRFKNKYGWGAILHRKVLIDTQPPRPFKIEIKEGKQTTNPRPTLVFETTDEMSGIDYYEIIIDGKSPLRTDKSEYKVPHQDLGKHIIIVKAVDKAGNETLAMTEIEILPIESPVITDYPRELLPGNILSVKGTALPETTVVVSIEKDKEKVKIGKTKSDKEGKWTYIEVEPLEKGFYQIWAETIDSQGAKSRPSEKVRISVSPPAFIKIGKLAIDYLTTIITLLILILVIVLGVAWSWQRIIERKKRLRKEVTEAEKALYRAFKALKKEVEEQVAKLDNKPDLNAREKKICDELKEALKISEGFIGKEIKDIKKELE